MSKATIEPFAPAHLDGLIALVAAEGWTQYADDVQRTYRALTAPGVTTLVAIVDGQVAGAIQIQSDGLIQAHVSMLLIDRNCRGGGFGSRLLRGGPQARRRPATGHPHPDRGLLRAAWCEPFARLPPHARESRLRADGN